MQAALKLVKKLYQREELNVRFRNPIILHLEEKTFDSFIQQTDIQITPETHE